MLVESLPFTRMHCFCSKTTKQIQEKGLNAVNQCSVHAAQWANGGETTDMLKKTCYKLPNAALSVLGYLN